MTQKRIYTIIRRNTYNYFLHEASAVLERQGMDIRDIRYNVKNNRQWHILVDGTAAEIYKVVSYLELYFRRYFRSSRKNPHLFLSTSTDSMIYTFCQKYDEYQTVDYISDKTLYKWFDEWHTTPTFNYDSYSYLYNTVPYE